MKEQFPPPSSQTTFLLVVLWLFLFFCLNTRDVAAQNSKSDIGLACRSDNDCIEGLFCIEVDTKNKLSVCLLACPQGQCLTGETCTLHSSGRKVCMCNSNQPCRTGFPCVNGFCPGSTYCHTQQRPCPTATFLCFQPITNNPWGVCVVPCSDDKDCPPPGTRCLPYQNKTACYCRQTSDCSSGYICVDFHCHQPCTQDQQCKKDEHCTGLICEPRPPDFPEPPKESSETEPVSQDTQHESNPPPSENTPDAILPESTTDAGWNERPSQDLPSPESTTPTDTHDPVTEMTSPEIPPTSEQMSGDTNPHDPEISDSSQPSLTDNTSPPGCRCSGHPHLLPSSWILLLFVLLFGYKRTLSSDKRSRS